MILGYSAFNSLPKKATKNNSKTSIEIGKT